MWGSPASRCPQVWLDECAERLGVDALGLGPPSTTCPVPIGFAWHY
jgi:hypothetical protein